MRGSSGGPVNDISHRTAEQPMNSLTRFETIAALYYRRFHRLAPGKDEPMAAYRSSGEPENLQQFLDWMQGGQAFEDAIKRVADLEERVRHLEAEVYD